MTAKERILAALRGEETDRIPWSPFLAYFWEAQPKSTQDTGMLKFYEEIGADPLFRGCKALYETTYKNSSIETKIDINEKFITYDTPAGKLTEKYVFTPNTNSWFLLDHPVKTREDFKILTYLYEDTVLKPDMEGFLQDYGNLGEKGLHLPVIGGPQAKTAFQSLIEHWVGTEELVYALADYPEMVEESLQAMTKVNLVSAEISVCSPAEAFIFWEDSSTTNISPAYFEKYSMPEIKEYARILHLHEKLLVHHACGHLKALLPFIAEAGIDMLESVSAPPTGNIMPWEVRSMLPDHIGIAGGIEPAFFLSSDTGSLEAYVRELIAKMGRKRFILSNADSCPPGVAIEKFRLVSKIVREIG